MEFTPAVKKRQQEDITSSAVMNKKLQKSLADQCLNVSEISWSGIQRVAKLIFLWPLIYRYMY